MKWLSTFAGKKKNLILVYGALVLVASFLSLYETWAERQDWNGNIYTFYENYVIFKNAFWHLISDRDLYRYHLAEHWDLYKYSPSFAVFMGFFAPLPDVLGLPIWNALNAFALLASIYFLPKLTVQQKGFIALFVAVELMTSLQNEQSNGLMAGLILFAFGFLEKRQYTWGTACLVASVFIKLFGIVAFALLLFYPKKEKLALLTVAWFGLIAALPLLFIDMDLLRYHYYRWGQLLAEDHSASLGISFMAILKSIFGITINKSKVALFGVVLFCFPLFRFKKYKELKFRYLALSSVLIWVLIFNHKAESPTFIIAMCGVGIWYFVSEKNRLNTGLFWFAFILTSLSATDICPPHIRSTIIEPFALKAMPCVLVWFAILWAQMRKQDFSFTN